MCADVQNTDCLNFQELSKQIQELNDKIDDIMLVIDDMLKYTTTYKESEALYQFA